MKTTQIFQLQKILDLSVLQPLLKQILALKSPDRKKIEQLKTAWAKQHRTKLPLNAELFQAATDQQKDLLKHILLTKPTRTLSGVSVIAIMPAPEKCVWGKCSYCPKGSEAPQSYTGYEPATLRARSNDYDAFRQVTNRLAQLHNIGHSIDKNELILIGGTFPALNWSYQKQFVANAFNAFNMFRQRNKPEAKLADAQRTNETAKCRVIGLTIETRPDYCPVDKLLQLGTTRVELGVQSIYDPVLKRVNRGHNIDDVYKTTRILKDTGLKVLYHIMPGLPGSTYKTDTKMLKQIFTDPKLKPDMLKIYPCLVIKGTKLYDEWLARNYRPISNQYLHKLMKQIYKMCPPWIRIMRVQRDIPSPFIEAGPKKSNIREEVLKELKLANYPSQEIRYREIGSAEHLRNIQINVTEYDASGGKEYFLAAEDTNKKLAGFLRLRIVENKAFVRELHVYGRSTPLGEEGNVQHRGVGKQLLARAEELTRLRNISKLKVLSGVGVREYYYQLGYKLRGAYVTKEMPNSNTC